MNSLAISFGHKILWLAKTLVTLRFYNSHFLNLLLLIGISPVQCVRGPLNCANIELVNDAMKINVHETHSSIKKSLLQRNKQNLLPAAAYSSKCSDGICCSAELPKSIINASQLSPALPASMMSSKHPRQRLILSRPKRYLSFPDGSSFSVAVCFTVGIIGNPRYNYMSFGLNWGVAYDLPNSTWILNHLHGFAKRPIPLAAWHRRSRRALFGEIERIVDNMGYNGHDCVLRALCESQQYFQNTKMGMIGEMLKVVFSLPKRQIHRREFDKTADFASYDKAYNWARSMHLDCSSKYDCNFSLIKLAFGYYSTPPANFYDQH